MKERQWAPHRRAYYPRLWPVLAVTLPICALASVLITFNRLVGVGASMILGGLAVRIRWMIWRRRHPVISAKERAELYMDDMRKNARWN